MPPIASVPVPLIVPVHSRVRRPATPRRSAQALLTWFLLGLGTLFTPAISRALDGVPLTRFYPYEEIGGFTRGVQLAHDSHGRLVVAQQGEFIGLNDTGWQTLWSGNPSGINLRKVAQAADGSLYYGAFGSWGKLEFGADGALRPRPLVPADAPAWVRGSIFDQMLCTDDGVYFSGLGGVVYWDLRTHRAAFLELHSVAQVFPFQGRVIVSSFNSGIWAVRENADGTKDLEPANWPPNEVVVAAAGNGKRSLLVAIGSRELRLLHDGRLEPLFGGAAQPLPGNVNALIALPEGGYAVGIAGWGGLVLDEHGAIRTTFVGPEFNGITALESHEPGVLWAAVEGGIVKILHGLPLTTFGRASGLPIDWPQVLAWRGRPIVGSGGRVYEAFHENDFAPLHFRGLQAGQPVGAWGIAVVGGELLLGSGEGVFHVQRDDKLVRVLPGLLAARLIALDANTCLAVGPEEIAALRRGPGGWVECASRVAGVGYPYIVHEGNGSAWLELGLNRVARITLEGDRLVVRLVEEFPWAEANWVNISIVGSTVALSGSGASALFLDEQTLAPVEAPALRRLFAESPHWIQRLCRDDQGRLWASYDRGVMAVAEVEGRWRFDDRTYAGINGPTPRVTALPGGDIWVSTGGSLHHLRPEGQAAPPPASEPLLLSIRNGRTNARIPSGNLSGGELGRFAYSANSLQLDFFAGSYAAVRPFSYECRLNDREWQRVTTGSSVLLSDLYEGHYDLAVRTVDGDGTAGPATRFRLEIAPPWYRRWFSFAAYPLLAAGLVLGVQRLAVRRARQRQAELERQVTERTGELHATMEQLEQVTMTSATLAERNRLAVEIHDSLEQGFAGLSLQLETTAGLSGCPQPVKAGLTAALNMVAFCRDEIRHAVQDLHSPILDSVDLGAALEQIATQLIPLADFATIRVEGTPRPTDPATEHHLLRIAQEAIANVVKHAAARHVEIVLAYETDGVRLCIRDDGKGFDPEAVRRGPGGHFGLPSFRNRASKIGGSVRIDSRRGTGTTITVRVPNTLPPKA